VERDVDHGSNGQNAFARQKLHENICGCEELSHDWSQTVLYYS
jgi:hypothetical protein